MRGAAWSLGEREVADVVVVGDDGKRAMEKLIGATEARARRRLRRAESRRARDLGAIQLVAAYPARKRKLPRRSPEAAEIPRRRISPFQLALLYDVVGLNGDVEQLRRDAVAGAERMQ